MQELPVLGRDMSRMYFLVPGVQATGTTAASEQPQDIYRPTIGGQYWGGIAFQLDGTDNRESVLGEPVITPNLDSVSELKITTTAYDAEFGQASQAVISAQTKSGTNQRPRQRLRVPPRSARRGARSVRAGAADCGHRRAVHSAHAVEPVRRIDRRPDSEGQDVLLRRLPGQPAAQRRVAADARSDRGRARAAI